VEYALIQPAASLIMSPHLSTPPTHSALNEHYDIKTIVLSYWYMTKPWTKPKTQNSRIFSYGDFSHIHTDGEKTNTQDEVARLAIMY